MCIRDSSKPEPEPEPEPAAARQQAPVQVERVPSPTDLDSGLLGFLTNLRLAHCAIYFAKLGAVEIAHLSDLEPRDLEELQLKPLERRRLEAAIRRLQSPIGSIGSRDGQSEADVEDVALEEHRLDYHGTPSRPRVSPSPTDSHSRSRVGARHTATPYRRVSSNGSNVGRHRGTNPRSQSRDTGPPSVDVQYRDHHRYRNLSLIHI